jgi:exodeoxyribonuclease V alpha subunit
MLDVPLARALARALPAAVRLVLVGDADQLPSVGPGAVLEQIIRSGVLPVVRLTEVFRQAARSQIVVGAHQVNQGQPLRPPSTPGPPGTAPGELFVVETEDAEHAARIIERTVCERIPERYGLDPVDDVQVLSPTKRGLTGTLRLNEVLQSHLNPGGEQISRGGHVLRAGDKVMQLRNNYDKDVFNGDQGRVLGLQRAAPAGAAAGAGPSAGAGAGASVGAGTAGSTSRASGQTQLIVRFDDRLVRYRREELEQLTLSYACTVHKSQGSEFPAVVMPLLGEHYMLLQRNLLYTALTRAQQLFVLVGSPRAIRRAIRNDQVRQRYTALAQRLRG